MATRAERVPPGSWYVTETSVEGVTVKVGAP
jgi:hypothetical protein